MVEETCGCSHCHSGDKRQQQDKETTSEGMGTSLAKVDKSIAGKRGDSQSGDWTHTTK